MWVIILKEKHNGRLFKLKERNTTVKTEFIAGLTSFFAMVYILMVNANAYRGI